MELAALRARQDGSHCAAQKACSGLILYIDCEGRLRSEKGLVRTADKVAAQEAGYLTASLHEAAPNCPKSPISQKLASDLALVATGARQHAALRDPELLLALLAFQMTGKTGHRSPFGLHGDEVAN